MTNAYQNRRNLNSRAEKEADVVDTELVYRAFSVSEPYRTLAFVNFTDDHRPLDFLDA